VVQLLSLQNGLRGVAVDEAESDSVKPSCAPPIHVERSEDI
jgi:hypothetical protein